MTDYPSPQSVGREFVRQYYTMLHEAPQFLHRFYSHDSSFLHGSVSDKVDHIAIGQSEIFQHIQALNFENCHTKIRQVDSQMSISNSVVIQVVGELSNNGLPLRRFVQTFLLAPQSQKKFYVHNDIFRYQEDFDNPETKLNDASALVNHDASTLRNDDEDVDAQRNHDVNVSGNDDNDVNAMVDHRVDDISVPSNGDVNILRIGDYQNRKDNINHYDNGEIAPSYNGNFNGDLQIDANIHMIIKYSEIDSTQAPSINLSTDNSVSSESTVNANQVSSKETKIEVETCTMKESIDDDAVMKEESNDEVQLPEHKQPGQTTNKPIKMTWAAMASKNTNNTHSGQETAAVMTPAVKSQATVGNKHESKIENALETQRHNNEEGGWQDDDSNKGTIYPDNQQVFVGNLPHNMLDNDLKEYFAKFGNVVDIRINRKTNNNLPNFGFVVFDRTETVKKILASRPLYKDGHRVNVEEKKPRDELYAMTPDSRGGGRRGGARPAVPNGRVFNNSRGGGGGGAMRGRGGASNAPYSNRSSVDEGRSGV